jgi:hypothetical protein
MQETKFASSSSELPAGELLSPGTRASFGFSGLLSKLFSYPAALAACLVAVTVLTLTNRFDNPDLWWHLKTGELIYNTHRIPTSEPFSFTAPGHPWIAHEWLAQVTMYGAYRLGGYTGLMIWISVFASLTFLLVYLLCWLLTHDALVSLRGGMVAFCFGTIGLSIRPLILGHLFLAAEILCLEMARTRSRRWLWALPPIFIMWVNCHASYAFGIGVLAVYFVSTFIRTEAGLIVSEDWDKRTRWLLGWMLVLCTVALCANPIGPRLILYPLDTLFNQTTNLGAVQEWLPPDLKQGRTWAMLAAVPAVLLLSMIRKSTLSIRELILMTMVSVLAMRHSRMLFLFGIVLSPILCRFAWGTGSKKTVPWANGAIICGCVAAVIWFFPNQTVIERQIRQTNPVQAVKYIREAHLAGPMLNEYNFGGFLIWRLPEIKVFIDGRADVYDPAGVMTEYLQWADLDTDPALLLDKYHIKFCLLFRDSAIAHALPYLPGWKRVYSDDLAVIFQKQ